MSDLSRRQTLTGAVAAAATALARPLLASPPATGAFSVTNADELMSALREGRPVVVLRPGKYGALKLAGIPGKARIISEKPGAAIFETMLITKVSGLDFEDVAFIPENRLGGTKAASIFRAEPSTDRIRLIRPVVHGAPQANSCEGWSVAEWKSRKAIGVWLRGPLSSVEGGNFYAIGFHAIMTEGADSLIRGNTLQWVAGDMMRALGDRSQVRMNRARNRVRPINAGEEKTDTHADFFQSWAHRGKGGALTAVTDIVFEGNLGIEWDAPAHPLAGYMQGVGFFDGPYINTVIRRNEIWCTAGHGITISNSQNSLVEDNVVGNLYLKTDKPAPWIRLDGAKGAVVRGNVAPMAMINRQKVAVTQIAYGRVRRSDFQTWPVV